jgi:hypothetical protein
MDEYIVVSCFDRTGIMVQPWADAGFECHIVDTQHKQGCSKDGNIVKWGMDVYEWEKIFFKQCNKKCIFASFFPPCTDLAVSGARWFANKELLNPGTRKRAMDLVYWSDRIGSKLQCPYFIENPVSVISSEWRKPDFSFHPYQYGGYKSGSNDGYTKKTCLWTGNGFKLPPFKPIPLDPLKANRIWKMAPGPERQNERSKTPAGFAQAIFEEYNKYGPSL